MGLVPAWHGFWFSAEELPRLLRVPRIPRRVVVLRNGSTFHMGKLRFTFSVAEEGVALLATRVMT